MDFTIRPAVGYNPRVMDATAPIFCEGLVKHYGDVQALRGLDLEVHAGEIFGLLGPNGAGKSTATKIFLTLVAPTDGRACVLGLDVTDDPAAIRRRVGYVPQELTSDQNLTGRENLDFFARIYHLPRAERAARVQAALERMGIAGAAERLVKTYSGGMRKRLDIATGLLHTPEVVFLDEPSLGLDVQARRAVWDEIERLKAEGVTMLLCTNYMDEADRLCDRLAIIQDGRILVTGTPAELKAVPGGDLIEIEASGGDNGAWEAFEKAARAVDGVNSVVREGNRARLTADRGERALPGILAAAGDAGLTVESLDFQRPSLDQVFLHFTGRHYTDVP